MINDNFLPFRHNAMPDHVHLLVRLPPTVKVSEFIGQVKGAATHRVNEEIQPSFKLKVKKFAPWLPEQTSSPAGRAGRGSKTQ